MATAAERPRARSDLLVSMRVPVYIKQVEKLTEGTVAQAEGYERFRRQLQRQMVITVAIVAILAISTVFGVWLVIGSRDLCEPVLTQVAGQTIKVCS